MLNIARHWKACLGVLLIAALAAEYLGWLFSCDPPAASENGQYGPYYGDCSRYRSVVIFAGIPFLTGVWHFIDGHHDIFLVIATAVIAWFTVTLSRATAGLERLGTKQARDMRTSLHISLRGANAARKAAEVAQMSLTDLERPYVYIFGPYQLVYVDEVFSVGIEYTVANYGRTPATIESIYGGLGVGKERPSDELEDASTFGRMQKPIYAPGREQEFTANLPADIDHKVFGEEDAQEIAPTLKEGEHLFLRIVVKYRGPFTGGHQTSACWVLDELNNRFGHFGAQKYNYEK